jgi:hypothetical protein
MVCEDWAVQGYGTPWPIYIAYVLKVAVVYVGGWWLISGGELWSAQAMQKAILWTIAYEGLGLGCGSGPLTGHYAPPLGGVLYFLRPGTTKAPLFSWLGSRRTWLDVLLYVGHYGLLARALMSPEITPGLVLPIAVVMVVGGVLDRTLYLSARGEHFHTGLVCLLFVPWVAGLKLVWLAVWWWAAVSKLNRHFPYVVCVMLSNNPLVPQALRKRLYRSFPDDLRPSTATSLVSHVGTAIELVFPAVLLWGGGGVVTQVALGVMLGFHIFITINIPMGVPLEWNVIMVYGAYFLFGHHGSVSVLDVGRAPLLVCFLAALLLAVPLMGNLVPSRFSFLSAMRYYAGNWAYSVWLFRGDCAHKLDDHLVKSSPRVQKQLAIMYDTDTIDTVMAKVVAFRAMHLHGRALPQLVPKAVDDIENYEWLDGEIVAGMVLGWNFGDGHLHNEQLLAAIQERCAFAEGELRCVFIESQPLFGTKLAWRIIDAATGALARGEVDVRDLEKLQPWPVAGPPAKTSAG